MMDTRCLTSAEVGAVLLRLLDDGFLLEEGLAGAFEDARAWDLRLVCHNLFVARHVNAAERGLEKIAVLYAAGEEMALEPEEGGENLVDYLLRHERNPEESLDEAMVAIEEGLSAHYYERALRY